MMNINLLLKLLNYLLLKILGWIVYIVFDLQIFKTKKKTLFVECKKVSTTQGHYLQYLRHFQPERLFSCTKTFRRNSHTKLGN